MPLVDHDHMVQAFSANTSDYPFGITVLPWTSRRYRNLSDTQSIHSCTKIKTIDPIPITQQIARCCIERKGFQDLLRRPSSGRVFCDIKVQNTAAVMRENEENIQHTQLNRRNREEIDRNHLANVISKKRHPSLRWLSRLLGHKPRHRPFRNLKSELLQFPMNPWCSPRRIGPCHGSVSGSQNTFL